MWRLLEVPGCGAAVEFGCSFGGDVGATRDVDHGEPASAPVSIDCAS